MKTSNTDIQYLHTEIDRFLDKYYLNSSIKGFLLSLITVSSAFLIFSTLFYFLELKGIIRLFLVASTGLFVSGFFIWQSLVPWLKSKRVIRRMNYDAAARLIGSMFSDISDRLINTLQLYHIVQHDPNQLDLLVASIAQKTAQLKVFNFSHAVNFRVNRKYLKYLLPSSLTILLLVVFVPHILTQGTRQMFDYSNTTPADFMFVLVKGNQRYEEGSDVCIQVNTKGMKIPENVYLVCDQGTFLMSKSSKVSFMYTLKNVKKSGSFYFEANGVRSNEFAYSVNGKSSLGKFNVFCKFPSYLNKKNVTYDNVGDLTVPEGTVLQWSGFGNNTSHVEFTGIAGSSTFSTQNFALEKKVVNSGLLKVVLTNAFSHKKDTIKYQIEVVKDAYPQIELSENVDSLNDGVRYFNGQIMDDYGLSSLTFHYKIIRKGKSARQVSLPVVFNKGTKSNFSFGVDFRRENILLEDVIEYYFMVKDNDGVNGCKSTRSFTGQYKLPDLQELNKERTQEQEALKNDLEKVLQRTKEFEKSVDKLKKEVMNSKSKDWGNKQKVQQLQQEQKSLTEDLQKVKNQLEQGTQEKNQLSELDKELLEKQEMIEKLLEEVMDEELKKLLDEIEKLLNEQNKPALQEELKKLDQSAEQRSQQLDRTLEMLKKLQVNERIDDLEKELKENAQKQEELRENLEKDQLSKEEGLKQQEAIKDRFEEIKKSLEDLKKLNSELLDPMNLDGTKALEESITEELSKSTEGIKDGKKSKSQNSQKNAADQMEQMAEQLNEQQQAANQQQAEEDMDMLREILESLMMLSFDQEALVNAFNKISTSDPKYRKLSRDQIRINTKTSVVKDSLLALAKRQPKVASFIDKELSDLDFSHNSTIEAIDDHRKGDILTYQQKAMTNYNNLALLLNETLQQMQSQMQSMKPGSGSCSKPGNGKPKPGGMSSGDMKEMLKKQLEQMKKGQSPGGKSPGDKEGNAPGTKPGSQGMSMLGLGNKEIAKMAAEQTAIRQRLEQLRNELNKDGQGSGNKLNPLIKELEQQERDLINKKFSPEMINRQKDILTRLLESEKAEMERGYEEKRESQSGNDEKKSNLIQLKEYTKEKFSGVEMIRTVDPSLNPYYRVKAEEYFNLVD